VCRSVAVPSKTRDRRATGRVSHFIAALLGLAVHIWPCHLAAQAPAPLVPSSPQPHASKPQPPEQGTITLKTAASGGLVLTTNGATRRWILIRLFEGHKVAIEWQNKEFADQKVYGVFTGSANEIGRRLLEHANYVAVYALGGGAPRVARIIVLGVAKGSVTLTPQPWVGQAQQDLKKPQRRPPERSQPLDKQRQQRPR